MTICPECRRGKHTQHDRWPNGGGDAGCPNQGVTGKPQVPCDCDFTFHHPRTNTRHCETCRCDGGSDA